MANSGDDGDISDEERLILEPLSRALGERYLTYAVSTISDRALPDARDGLKPVHRRILYVMGQLGLTPGGRFLKCAKISGDTMGDFHPHGNQAIYDALARMAQPFAMRYPLVEGQGNFGNIDGDSPAADRYTEARLTPHAMALLEGLSEDPVDFRPNYDGRKDEPVVLPAAFPNLLANGSSGIAVGMATNIPPHNIGELCDAALALIQAPEATDADLMAHVQGPDFPTGGVLIDPPETLLEAYRTGRGALRLRARWAVEDLGRGQWQVIVSEIPYQVQKSKLIERLADLVTTKKIPILADVRDESAEDVRIVLEPRARTVDPAVLMESLFKLSDLETRFSLNMNVLIDGRTPQVSSLRTLLRAFLDHRRAVLQRRTRHRLEKIAHRLEVLAGYIIAFLNLDRVIQIIRSEDEPKPVLMAEFTLTDTQAEAILNMRLRSLRRLEEMELRREETALTQERDELSAMLDSDTAQWTRIGDEIRDIATRFGREAPGGARRTELAEAPEVEDVPLDMMIEREPVTIVCSENGWIRAMKGHLSPDVELKYKDGDGPGHIFHAETTDKILLFGSNGRFYTLSANLLPGGRGAGEPVRLMVDLPNEARIVALFAHRPGGRLIVASSAGDGFAVAEGDIVAQTRAGKQVLSLKEGVRAQICRAIAGDHVAVVGENRKLLVFPLSDLPDMARGKGVRLQKYKDGGLSDLTTLTLADGLSWKDPAGRTRTERDLTEWLGKRASAGRMAPRGFPRSNRFSD